MPSNVGPVLTNFNPILLSCVFLSIVSGLSFVIWHFCAQKARKIVYYDSCDASTVSILYSMKMIIGPYNLRNDDSGNLILDYLDGQRSLRARIEIPLRDIINNSIQFTASKTPNTRIFSFNFGRMHPLTGYDSLRIYHSSTTPRTLVKFILYLLLIKDPLNYTIVVPVSSNIRGNVLLPDKQQIFKIGVYSNDLFTQYELLLSNSGLQDFLTFSFCMTGWALLYTLMIPQPPTSNITIMAGTLNGFVGCNLAAITIAIIICFHALIMNSVRDYPLRTTRAINLIYLIGIAILSGCVGLGAALMASSYPDSHTAAWAMAQFISALMQLAIFEPMYFVAPRLLRWYANLKNGAEIDSVPTITDNTELQQPFIAPSDSLSKEQMTPKLTKKRKAKGSTYSVHSTGTTYYETLMMQGTIPRVMSISQYGPLFSEAPAGPPPSPLNRPR